jgi:hypothetical protein
MVERAQNSTRLFDFSVSAGVAEVKLLLTYTEKARNPNLEIRNKFKTDKFQCSKHRGAWGVWNFEFLSFEFVAPWRHVTAPFRASDFEFRIFREGGKLRTHSRPGYGPALTPKSQIHPHLLGASIAQRKPM